MRHPVTEFDTAAAVGSGDVPVLATPRLVAWMEAATVRAAADFVQPGQTTVGTAIRVQHHRASPVGTDVDVIAEAMAAPSDRRVTFLVRATDAAGQLVASGQIDRMIVDRDRFVRSAHG